MSTYVIRPGETDFDLQDRVQGTLDIPLNSHGQAQVEQLLLDLRPLQLERLYASPTEPALSTARRLAVQLDIPLKVIPSLYNIDLGLWQGMTYGEIRQKQPRVYRQWEEAPESVCPPLGEPFEQAYARVTAALRKPMRRGGTFAVVAGEPLATLVGTVLRGEIPRLCCPHGLFETRDRVESMDRNNLPVAAGLAVGK